VEQALGLLMQALDEPGLQPETSGEHCEEVQAGVPEHELGTLVHPVTPPEHWVWVHAGEPVH